MNDCFPVAYVFSAIRNRISRPARAGICRVRHNNITLYLYMTLLLESEFFFIIFYFASRTFFFRHPSDLQKHISRAGYCIFIFFAAAREVPFAWRKRFFGLRVACIKGNTVVETRR